MALVKCPECGKENISDAATTCPSCGYGIKEHFDLIRQKEAFDEKKQKDREKIQKQYEDDLQRIDKMHHPSKPSLFGTIFQGKYWIFVPACLLTLLALICIVLSLCGIAEKIDIWMFLLGAFWGIIAFVTWKIIKDEYDRALDKYENWDKYIERLKNDAANQYDTRINDLKKQEFEAPKSSTTTETVVMPRPTYGLKCPVCNSRNVKRISNTSRAISVELMGLASSKIAKQYQCKDCKHMW